MQPAPLINKPPAIINTTSSVSGGVKGVSHSDHPAGISKISLPLGLSQRSNEIKFLMVFTANKFFTFNFFLERLNNYC